MQLQFKAGYISDSIIKVVTDFKASLDTTRPIDQSKLDQINGLLQHVSSFDVEFPTVPYYFLKKHKNP